MAFSKFSVTFFTILKETIKILPKNGKLMSSIAIYSIILSSSLFLLLNCFLQSLMQDMHFTMSQAYMPDPTKITALLDHIKEDTALLLTIEIAFIFASFVISFFVGVATIYVSAMSYTEKTVTLKDLLSMICRKWTKPLITSFYIFGLAMGYFTFLLVLITPLLILYPNRVAISIAIFLAIFAYIFYLYLYVTLALAFVVSVVEESSYGIEALRRAAWLGKGNRFQGFLLICVNVVALIIFQGLMISLLGNRGLVSQTISGLFVVIFSSLLSIFLLMAYTVLYFHCKKEHGEENIELHGSFEYTKLPTAMLANNIP